MGNIEKDLAKLKLEISQGWRLLFRHKWQRPTWIRFPRSVIGDIRWIRLSDRAKAAWPIMLILASEDENAQLPNAEIVYRRLREVGLSPRKDSFSSLIDEYIQGGFILKTSPEYRVQGTEYTKKERYTPASEASLGFASPAPQEKRLGEEGRVGNHHHLGQPKPLIPIPQVDYAAALGLFRPPIGRFDRVRSATPPQTGAAEVAAQRQRLEAVSTRWEKYWAANAPPVQSEAIG